VSPNRTSHLAAADCSSLVELAGRLSVSPEYAIHQLVMRESQVAEFDPSAPDRDVDLVEECDGSRAIAD
jgi:hypothetical protein